MKPKPTFRVYNRGNRRLEPCPILTAPQPEKFTSPKWLRAYRFFSHESLNASGCGWSLSEVSSGCAVVSGCDTRQKARQLGLTLLRKKGEAVLKASIATAHGWIHSPETCPTCGQPLPGKP